ncbi:MAG: lytic transglycosylase domain-containing protein [Myxococcota bacterium]|nr:lytic transglycosylase domain-containing protein [Myxococcota bacterium]
MLSLGAMRRIPTLLICMAGLLSLSATGPEGPPPPEADSLRIPGPGAESTHAEPSRAQQRALAEETVREALQNRRHHRFSPTEIQVLARAIVTESDRHDFDPALVMAVIHVESSGNPDAVSHVGARGLMQLMPNTAEEIAGKLELDWKGPDSLFDPVVNVTLGIAYLRQLNDRFDNIPMALAAYNWGPGRIYRRIRRGDSLPVRYIDKVRRAYGADLPSPAQRS